MTGHGSNVRSGQVVAEEKCSEQVRAGRLENAKQFLRAAELVKEFSDEDEIADAYVTLCVHAGIAAADVICCARLGRYARRQPRGGRVLAG